MIRNYQEITSYKKLLDQEIDNLNNKFNPFQFHFKLGDPGYSFNSIYPDSYSTTSNIYWAKVFIVKDEIQIGRITYRFENGNMERYYIKQYKPFDIDYDSNDNIFYYFKYYFANKPIPLDFNSFVKTANQIRIFVLAEKTIWRMNNPLMSKERVSANGKVWMTHRKKLQGMKIRTILDKLVDWDIKKNENPFPKFFDYIISLNEKPNNTADLFLHFYQG